MQRAFLLLTFFIHCSELFSQQYVRFPSDSARWKITYSSGALGCPGLVAEYQYEFSGDTIVAALTYHKISRLGYTNQIFCYPPAWGYVGAIREDSARHVYYLQRDSTTPVLLYDFNLNVGDTIFGYLTCGCSDITVDSIDSVFVQSGFRRRYILGGCPNLVVNTSIIEGIGCTNGLLECISTFESGGNLDCFESRSQTIYPDTTTYCPMLIEDIIAESADQWAVFPIPATDRIELIAPAISEVSTLVIINIAGEVVRVENVTATEGSITVNRNGLESGIYFIEISDGRGITSRIKFAFL